MSYDDCILRVERLQNGWEVEVFLPSKKAEDAEEKAEAKGLSMPYADPWRGFAFSKIEEVLAFIAEKLPDLKPRNYDDDYEEAFDAEAEKLKGKKK